MWGTFVQLHYVCLRMVWGTFVQLHHVCVRMLWGTIKLIFFKNTFCVNFLIVTCQRKWNMCFEKNVRGTFVHIYKYNLQNVHHNENGKYILSLKLWFSWWNESLSHAIFNAFLQRVNFGKNESESLLSQSNGNGVWHTMNQYQIIFEEGRMTSPDNEMCQAL